MPPTATVIVCDERGDIIDVLEGQDSHDILDGLDDNDDLDNLDGLLGVLDDLDNNEELLDRQVIDDLVDLEHDMEPVSADAWAEIDPYNRFPGL